MKTKMVQSHNNKWKVIEVTVKLGIVDWHWVDDIQCPSAWIRGEWMQLLQPKGWNWYTFRPFHLEFEYELWGPLFSIDFSILGFGLSVGINPPWETKQSKELHERSKEAREHPERSIPWEDFKDEWENEGGSYD